jgi:di/tricarboxylate transporter
MGIACLIVYLLFLIMFLMISRKHIRRIRDYTDEFVSIFQFFDARSYIIMAVMIGLGAAVRLSELVPGFIIAFFYSGLGLALITSGVYYVVSYIALCDELKAHPSNDAK